MEKNRWKEKENELIIEIQTWTWNMGVMAFMRLILVLWNKYMLSDREVKYIMKGKGDAADEL